TDSSNAVATNVNAAKLGHKLFFDPRLSVNGQVSCSTCHQPSQHFSDGKAKGFAIGEAQRNTPSIVGSAYSPWFYWDGRKDSLWAQALAPLEHKDEHGGNRMAYIHFISGDEVYRPMYQELFGDLPDISDPVRFPANAAPGDNPEWNKAWQAMANADQQSITRAFTNLGKCIAAYEMLLVPQPSRFDYYIEAELSNDSSKQQSLFSPDEKIGLRLFIGKAGCINCHNGPLLTNNEFHNTGLVNSAGEIPDKGRVEGERLVRVDPFNCAGEYSDSAANDCDELRFMRSGTDLIGAMRTPSLRNLGGTGPFMHKGQVEHLSQVLDHYNRAPEAMIGHNEAEPLGLNDLELRQLEDFLNTLNSQVLAPIL
ncbi:MAG TPA: cytochrome-c peroxidase, partial [Gammaproteobacteria bacterium]|nr:cytochrome-c peroxidase [Gammaproteobacteria bacterium]